MKWVELRARVEAEVADDVAAIFARFGHGGSVVEEDLSQPVNEPKRLLTIKAYLPSDRLLSSKKKQLSDIIGHLSLIYPINLEEQILTEQDWAEAWKVHFVPHKVGRRLVIKPSWREYQPTNEEVIIELDPGMAFGTGLHPTTRLCLQSIESYIQPGWQVLDLGTGSGIQALAAAKLGAKHVLALDNDPIAVKVARANVRANKLSRRISVRLGSLPLHTDAVNPGDTMHRAPTFDMVVANIIASVIQELAQPLISVLNPSGILITGGIVTDKLDGVKKALEEAGGAIIEVLSEGDWRTIVAKRRE
ncbi:MAG: 50S ribosomal protein L11 methyltransferase [Dehalococcoidia bacterium]|nr:50S ribosomal protein L11 methyltransferase [Dehalococcoidia bacterium]